jgi:hypothetical protein
MAKLCLPPRRLTRSIASVAAGVLTCDGLSSSTGGGVTTGAGGRSRRGPVRGGEEREMREGGWTGLGWEGGTTTTTREREEEAAGPVEMDQTCWA